MANKKSENRQINRQNSQGKPDQNLDFIAKKMKTSEDPKSKQKKKNTSLIISIAILALIFFLALSVRVKMSTFVFQTPISGEHLITERIPYQEMETYYVTEEYKDQVPFGRRDCKPRQMEFNVTFDSAEITSDMKVKCSMTIYNLENATGNWSYNSQIRTPITNFFNSPVTKEIGPYSSEEFEWLFSVKETVGELNCNYLQEYLPSTIKCFYAEPITYQTVTKTRTVQKNKSVTKYKEVESLTNETTYTNSTKKVTSITFFGKDLFQIG